MGVNKAITLKFFSYDSKSLDSYLLKVNSLIKENDLPVVGPIPLTMNDNKNILHIFDKNSYDNKIMNNTKSKHTRVLLILNEGLDSTILNKIMQLKIPSGIGIDIKTNYMN